MSTKILKNVNIILEKYPSDFNYASIRARLYLREMYNTTKYFEQKSNLLLSLNELKQMLNDKKTEMNPNDSKFKIDKSTIEIMKYYRDKPTDLFCYDEKLRYKNTSYHYKQIKKFYYSNYGKKMDIKLRTDRNTEIKTLIKPYEQKEIKINKKKIIPYRLFTPAIKNLKSENIKIANSQKNLTPLKNNTEKNILETSEKNNSIKINKKYNINIRTPINIKISKLLKKHITTQNEMINKKIFNSLISKDKDLYKKLNKNTFLSQRLLSPSKNCSINRIKNTEILHTNKNCNNLSYLNNNNLILTNSSKFFTEKEITSPIETTKESNNPKKIKIIKIKDFSKNNKLIK